MNILRRALVSLIALVSVMLIAPLLQAQHAEDKAVAFVEQKNGEVDRDGRKVGNQVVSVYLTYTPVRDADLKQLVAFSELQHLDLIGTVVTGPGLKDLASLHRLKSLNLGSSAITDAGLKGVVALKELQRLDLSLTGVTDLGVKELAALKRLKTLDLSKTQVTDAGVAELQRVLPRCKIIRE